MNTASECGASASPSISFRMLCMVMAGGTLQASQFQEGRTQIAEIDEVVHAVTGREVLSPANRQRHATAHVIAVAQATTGICQPLSPV